MDIELIEDASVFQHWINMLDIIQDYRKDIADFESKTGCLYFQMADGGVIGFKGARANRQLILSTLVDSEVPDPSDLQWTPVAFCKNMDEPMTCDETGETINVSPEVSMENGQSACDQCGEPIPGESTRETCDHCQTGE